jgi:hypothetical protein
MRRIMLSAVACPILIFPPDFRKDVEPPTYTTEVTSVDGHPSKTLHQDSKLDYRLMYPPVWFLISNIKKKNFEG